MGRLGRRIKTETLCCCATIPRRRPTDVTLSPGVDAGVITRQLHC